MTVPRASSCASSTCRGLGTFCGISHTRVAACSWPGGGGGGGSLNYYTSRSSSKTTNPTHLEPIRVVLHVRVQPLAVCELHVTQIANVSSRRRTGRLQADELGHELLLLSIVFGVGQGNGNFHVVQAFRGLDERLYLDKRRRLALG